LHTLPALTLLPTQVNRYHSERTDLWTELNEEERALAIVEHNAFKPTLDISPRSVDAIWSCGHCAMSPLSIMALKQHVRDMYVIIISGSLADTKSYMP
jgi:hypothetical protein